MSSSATPRFPLLNISSSTRRASALFSSADIGSTPFLQPLMGFSYCDNGRKDQSCQGDGFPRMSPLGSSVHRGSRVASQGGARVCFLSNFALFCPPSTLQVLHT